MSLILLAANLLESSTVSSITTTAMLAAKPKTRFYDRDRGAQGEASAAGQFDVDIVFSSAATGSAVGIVNHNIASTLVIYVDTASAIGTTLIDTLTPSGDPYYGTFASSAGTKWRLRFANFGSALKMGELLLGVPSTLPNPLLESGGVAVIGNTQRDLSHGGYAWGTRKGAARARLSYDWLMLDADLVIFKAAYADVNEGAKNLLVRDPDSANRWMFWSSVTIEPTPLGGTGGNNRVKAVFEEAL